MIDLRFNRKNTRLLLKGSAALKGLQTISIKIELVIRPR